MWRFLIVLCLALIFCSSSPSVSVSADGNTVGMVIDPTPKTVVVGDTFSVNIIVTISGGMAVHAAEAHIDFDPVYLQVVGMTPGAALPVVLGSSFNNTRGTIDYPAEQLWGAPPTADFVLVTLKLRAKKVTGGTPLTFVYIAPTRLTEAWVDDDPVLDHSAVIDGSVSINPIPAPRLEVNGSTTMTAGGSNDLTITARDQYGNVNTGYDGIRSLTFSGPSVAAGGQQPTVEGIVVGTATAVNFTNGVSATGAVTLVAYRAETTTVDVSDDTLNSSGGHGLALTVYGATAARLEVAGSTTMSAGGSSELTIRAKDQHGNLAAGYDGTRSLTFFGPGVAPGGQQPTVEGIVVGTVTAVNFTNGVSAASAATLVAYRAESTTVDASDGSIDSFADPAYNLDITVNAGAVSRLVFVTVAQTIIAGQPSAVMTVQTQDEYSNPTDVTTTATLTLSSSSASDQKTFSLSPTTWVDITSVTLPAGQNSASFHYKDPSSGTPLITVAETPSLGWTDASQQQTVSPVVLVGEIDLQGRPPKGDEGWVTTLTVTFLQNGVVVRTENVITDNQGRFAMTDITTGTYDMMVKGARTLSNLVVGQVILPGTNLVHFGILREGDANNDNAITEADYAVLWSFWGQTSGEALDKGDFNRDGAVTGFDYALLWYNFGQTGDT